MVDIREFEDYAVCHLKSSYHMDAMVAMEVGEEGSRIMEVYCKFLACYHENYPDNLIILIGDQENFGHLFA